MIGSVCRHAAIFLPAFFFASFGAVGDEEDIAPLASFTKTYELPEPMGQLVVSYAADSQGNPTLKFKCSLFEAAAPLESLTDLPRPAWDRLSVNFGNYSDKAPLITMYIPLEGTADVFWVQTHAVFSFDANGNLRRFIKWVPGAQISSGDPRWEEWTIGAGISASSVLRRAEE